MNKDTVVIFNGEVLTIGKIAELYCNNDYNKGIALTELLITKGQITIPELNNDNRLKIINKAKKEQNIEALATYIEIEEDLAKQNKAIRKRENKLLYPEIELDYNNFSEAVAAETLFIDKLKLQETEISRKNGIVTLIIRNITDKELNYIKRTYKADNAINSSVQALDKGVSSILEGVDYTSKKILTPATKIITKGFGSLFKSVVSTSVRTGASFVSNTGKAIRDTKEEIVNDTDVIKASRDLIKTKDSLSRSIKSKTSKNNNGLRIKI